MLNCPFCAELFASLVILKGHLNCSHKSEWKIPFKCGQDDCFKSYDRKTLWSRHMRTAHKHFVDENLHLSTISEAPEQPLFQDDIEDVSFRDFENEEYTINSETQAGTDLADIFAVIELSASQFVAGLRANSSVTINICELAVNSCNDVTESVLTYLKMMVLMFFNENVIEIDISKLMRRFDELMRPLEFLSTEKKQNAYFAQQPGFVAPQRITFGPPRFEPKNVPGGQPIQKAVYDTWQYVSIGKTLSSILSIPQIFHELKNSKPDDADGEFIQDFKDGSLYKEHPLVADNDKIVAVLQLYYDDMEVANPLGPNAGLHKQGLFYFTIRNLPPFFTSTMANIHLTAIGKTVDWKNYGYEQTLVKIKDELNVLATKGIEIQIDGEQNTRIFACLAAVNGDNLGRHTILGLVESFRATHFCAQCMALNNEIQTKFHESDFEMRTQESYEVQLAVVLDAKKDGTNMAYEQAIKDFGIKSDCHLNGAGGWHLTRNKIGDLMHDFLEGVGEFELKLVLYHLVDVQKLFSLEDLKGRIGLFPYGMTDQKNRPREIMNLRDVHGKNDQYIL